LQLLAATNAFPIIRKCESRKATFNQRVTFGMTNQSVSDRLHKNEALVAVLFVHRPPIARVSNTGRACPLPSVAHDEFDNGMAREL